MKIKDILPVPYDFDIYHHVNAIYYSAAEKHLAVALPIHPVMQLTHHTHL